MVLLCCYWGKKDREAEQQQQQQSAAGLWQYFSPSLAAALQVMETDAFKSQQLHLVDPCGGCGLRQTGLTAWMCCLSAVTLHIMSLMFACSEQDSNSVCVRVCERRRLTDKSCRRCHRDILNVVLSHLQTPFVPPCISNVPCVEINMNAASSLRSWSHIYLQSH